ncbi:MAG TPA: PAS domain S-box protein, partial [Methanospirillum sp.]|uniref:PAS domain S-box protein n=1 Tax=Methanospirillum sp. TaxID=45200 RepID=UPI002B74BE06
VNGMASSEREASVSIRILSFLKENQEGANIIEISENLGLGRNLAAKHLTNLYQTGRLDLRTIGKNKIYRLAHRVPFHIYSDYPILGAIGFNRSLLVHETTEVALKILGCTEADLMGKWIEDIPHPLFQKSNLVTLARGVLDEKLSPPQITLHEIGNMIFRIIISFCIFDDSSIGIAVILIDLTNIEKNSLKEQLVSNRLNALMQETGEFIVDLDSDDRIIRENQALARYYGGTSTDFIGLRGLPSIAAEDLDVLKHTVALDPDSLQNPSAPFEIRVVMPDGNIRYQEWRAYPDIRNDILWSLHCVGSDITEKRNQEAIIRHYEAGLSTIVEEKTTELREVTKNLRKEIDELKKNEQNQYLNQNRYQRLTEMIHEIIWETNENHEFTFVSAKVEDYLGYQPESLIGKHFFEIVDDTIGQYRPLDFVSLLVSGKPIDRIITPIRSSDGSTCWFVISGVPHSNPDGIFYGYHGIAQDITRQVLEEEQKSELVTVIESTPDIITITHEDGTLMYLNQAGKKFFGLLDQSDISQINVFSYIPELDIQDYQAKRLKAVEAGSWRGDTVILSGSGTLVPLSQIIQYHRHEPSKKSYFSTILRHISERLAFEQKLATAYEYSRMLTEVNPDLIVTFSLDGKIFDVNAAVERVIGYSRDKIVGKEYFQFFSEPERIKTAYRQLLTEGSPVHYTTDILHQNGSKIPVIGNCVVIRDQTGNVTGIFASARVIHQENVEGVEKARVHELEEEPRKPPPG